MFKNRGKASSPQVDIVASENALLGKVAYDRNNAQSNADCTVTVKSSPFDEKEATSENPLHGVIVHITPKGSGDDYELFLKAAQRRLGLIYSCNCEHKGYKLALSQGKGLGISTSFNHSKDCLKKGKFLRLG